MEAGCCGGYQLTWTLITPEQHLPRLPPKGHFACSTGCQAQPLDLVFMLDASVSVGPENFARMQSFVRSCALRFDVNPDVTQIGLVVYGGRVQTAKVFI